MEPVFFDKMLQSWGLVNSELRGALMIFTLVACTALVSFIVSRVVLRLERKTEQTGNLWDDTFLHALRRPAAVFVWLQGVYWAAELAKRYSDAGVFGANKVILQVGVIWLIAWALVRFVHGAEQVVMSGRMRQPMDHTTASAISKLVRASIIITAVLVIMQTMGYSISGVLAFGGIGGIAVGFAARDLLANFFGGFMIYMDRPFKVGDWIRSPEKNIEGTVEHIGWRLTRIRTFDARPLYVPNATFTQIAVENPSRMSNRRIYETVGIRYCDVHRMQGIVQDVRAMLEQHEEIDTDRTLIVNFNSFNASSLDFFIYTFTRTTEWVKYHAIKQDVLLRVSEIIASHGAEIAFPTRTLHWGAEETPPEDLDLGSTRAPQRPPAPRQGGLPQGEA